MLLNLTFQHHSLALLSFPVDKSGADFWLCQCGETSWSKPVGEWMKYGEASRSMKPTNIRHGTEVANGSSPLPIDIAFIGLQATLKGWDIAISNYRLDEYNEQKSWRKPCFNSKKTNMFSSQTPLILETWLVQYVDTSIIHLDVSLINKYVHDICAFKFQQRQSSNASRKKKTKHSTNQSSH